MPIRCQCGRCNTEFWAPDKFAGRLLACPVCESWVSAPGGEAAAPKPAEPKPLADLFDEEPGPPGLPPPAVPTPSGGSPTLAEGAWGSDGTWHGIGHVRRQTLKIPLEAGISIFTIGALVFYGLILLSVPQAAEYVGWVFFALGVGIVLLAWGWEALIAMRGGIWRGIYVIVIPFYGLLYFLNDWDKTRRAFMTGLMGVSVCVLSLLTILFARYLAGEFGPASIDLAAEPVAQAPATQPGQAVAEAKAPGGTSTARAGTAQGAAGPQQSPSRDSVGGPGDVSSGTGTRPAGTAQTQSLAGQLSTAPPPDRPFDQDVTTSPIERAYEQATRQYAARVAVDLLAGDDATLQYRMRWFAEGRRPVIGLRWGLGVEIRDPASPAAQQALQDQQGLLGAVALGLIAGLESRLKAGAFGDWPDQGDPRCRQVGILPSGPREGLLAAARRRRLDMLIVLQPLPAPPAIQSGPSLPQVQIIDVVTDRVLWTWQPSGASAMGLAVRPGQDPAGAPVAEILAYIRDRCELLPMPQLDAERVQTRLKELEAEKARPENHLPILVELRYYQLKQLLSVEETARQNGTILGPDQGKLLATGEPILRRQLLEAWLKGS